MQTNKRVNEKANTSSTSNRDYTCKRCNRSFNSLQECLKHELLEHSLTKKRPEKSLRNQMQTLAQIVQDEEKQKLRVLVESALDSCAAGEELKAILKIYCVDTEKLEQAYLRIHTCLEKELQKIGGFNICPFGSVANGLALESSDIDIYIQIDDLDDPTSKHFRIIFNRVSSFLFRSQCFCDIVPIRQARVPIIKCKHVPSGFSIDINMSCPSSVNNTNFLLDIIRFDSRIHQLLLFLKIWSKQWQIIGRGGNMTSYCLIILALFYLQNTPNSKQKNSGKHSILPSLRELQRDTAPIIVQGVNYAYDLLHVSPLSKEYTVRSLIEGFFKYYAKFDFNQDILSPFLGCTISKEEFISNSFQSYKDQLRALTIIKGSPAVPLQVQKCICVQDIFCLNLNVARAITPPNFEYIHHCLTCAADICSTESQTCLNDAQFYRKLLYGIIEQVSRAIEINRSTDSTVPAPISALHFTITPSRIDMRTLVKHFDELLKGKTYPNKIWVELYIDLIKEILTEIYKLDIQQAVSTHCPKNQKLENSNVTQIWLLTGSIDMWTGRTFKGKSSTEFMRHQKQLTENFQEQRRQNAAFAVQLNALLHLNIAKDYSAIKLEIQPTASASADVNKKNPLRKFFANFKCGLQSFNLKEKLPTATNAATKLLQGLEMKEENGQVEKKLSQTHAS